MARTVAQIYLSIIAEKNNQTSLNALQPAIDSEQQLLSDVASPSKVADWRIWAYIMAIVIWTHEVLWDLFKSEVDAIVADAIPGTARWLRNQALLFQYGDSLTWIDNKYQYAVIDATKQIIKFSAVIETGGQIRLKVAKLVGGVPTKLNSTELAAFQVYINQIKFAGTNVLIISYDPDLLKITYSVKYDPLVLAADGSLISDPSIFPVENALNAYISGIEWAGIFNFTKSTDAIQAASGIVDPVITAAEGKPYAGSYAVINQNYESVAGYMQIDPAFPLSSTITYIANV
jgi:hypothetical protein